MGLRRVLVDRAEPDYRAPSYRPLDRPLPVSSCEVDQEQPDTEELFEQVCLDTLKNGGDVSFIPSVSVPNGNQIAAILRFTEFWPREHALR